MQTSENIALEKRGNDGVKMLRKTKHDKGLPFMINVKKLPVNQCYLEYPDGRLLLVSIKSPTDRDFTVLRELSAKEKAEVLHNYLPA